ncbi:aspartate dehydrogenase [Ignicoccus islandicus DSM 13165]|uniref:L-aspartate dehydrogenase n=1 Tax=Ignicoccus islandicus DSM 13165 TaxID=940295 RepID=A0A0U3F523_9CREN|nr:aspartate dehydrogenase [Ignicoccus islandicus DSM 13165]
MARILKRELANYEFTFFDRNPNKCSELGKYVNSFEELMEADCDLVVEAASPMAVREYAERALEKADLVVLSVGALIDEELYRKLVDKAKLLGRRIYVPSGAIAGIDAIKALRRVGINEIEIEVRKNPKSLGVSANDEKVLFYGDAKEAVEKFPFNVNVVATLKLASGAPVKVKVVADPSINRNVHTIRVKSKASDIFIRVENVPSPYNPKTSYLAVLSIIELVEELSSPHVIRIGN